MDGAPVGVDRVGGRAAGKVMREYQQTATELGYLHHRYLRGTAPEDVVPRGQLMVDRLVWLRPGIVWPPVTGPAPPLAWQPR